MIMSKRAPVAGTPITQRRLLSAAIIIRPRPIG